MTPVDVSAASAAIRAAIEDAHGPLPPGFVVEFLLKPWRRYLALVHCEHGPTAPEWRSAVETTHRLLWSIAPKSTPAERRDLSRSLTSLLAAVKTGLEIAGADTATRNAFLGQLGDLHLAMMTNTPLTSEGAEPEPAAAAGDAPPRTLSDTISMDVRDPRYRQLLDLLESDNVEQIDM